MVFCASPCGICFVNSSCGHLHESYARRRHKLNGRNIVDPKPLARHLFCAKARRRPGIFQAFVASGSGPRINMNDHAKHIDLRTLAASGETRFTALF
jgi:hypothetical protein